MKHTTKWQRFTLLATIMLLAAPVFLSSCDNDDDPKVPNSVTIDGIQRTILKAGIDKSDLQEDGNYDIVLFWGANEGVKIMASHVYHNGKLIDLTKKEPEHDGWYWAVEAYMPNCIIDTYAEPGTSYPVFQSGTLYLKRLSDDSDGNPVFEIKLVDGKVKGTGEYGDGKEHTISLYYKGSMEFDEY